MKEIRDCFVSAVKDEKKGRKHKGLLIVKLDDKTAKEYHRECTALDVMNKNRVYRVRPFLDAVVYYESVID